LAVAVTRLDFGEAVALVFAVAASTFCPLLVLGIWWRRLTDVGAIAGVVVGGALSVLAVVDTLLQREHTGWVGALLAQPAAWTVPTAFLTMVVVSLVTPHRIPAHVSRTMVRLHTPETVDLDRGPQPL
jgi:Na+(H+)/acetate symporter ActP